MNFVLKKITILILISFSLTLLTYADETDDFEAMADDLEALVKKEEYQKAINTYSKYANLYHRLVKNKNKLGSFYNDLGLAYARCKAYKNAIILYEKSIKLGPDVSRNLDAVIPYYNLGFAYYQLKKFDKALENINFYLQYDPEHNNALRMKNILERKTEAEKKKKKEKKPPQKDQTDDI